MKFINNFKKNIWKKKIRNCRKGLLNIIMIINLEELYFKLVIKSNEKFFKVCYKFVNKIYVLWLINLIKELIFI